MKRGSFVITVVFLVLASGSLTSFDETAISRNLESADGPLDESLEIDPVDTDYYPSQDELQGILNPVVIEQRGNKTTSSLHAETDSKTNVMANLTIDVANDWVGSKASVNLWDLNRLYVENGSVSEGIEGATKDPVGSVLFYPYGWDAVSGSPDSNMEMLAEYSNQELGVAANGYSSGDDYFHVNGSYVYWTQTVNNTPYLESFIFNVDFLYDRGPLANSNVTLHALVDDTLIWNTTAETLLDSTWYNSGNVLVDLTDIGSQFEFKIGLYFDGNVSHTKKYIRFCIDNMKLVGEISPTFDDANIHFNIGGESVVIAGTSTGLASIINSSLWKSENVLIEFTSDLSYSFDYTGTMLSSHYLNSTQSPNQSDGGVHFSSQLNGGSMLTLYTFLGVLPDIDDFTLIISHPVDWENITVYNPFGTIVTSSCIIDSGTITIPNAILYTLGWWEIRLESPNYVRSIQTLKLNEPTLTWFPATVFRSTNITKPFIEIGESVPIPNAPQNVNISWFMPNGTEWFSESISGGSNGIINGSQLEFGPLNTTAGIWQVQVSWTNGTELAFGNVIFEIHHGASLAPHESVIHAEGGLSVSNFVYYQDSENNEFLMDPVASVTANWSVTTVNFIPDSIHNWWVGTFDTSLIGPGNHLVVVNVSRPFFDDVSCEFFLTISFTDNDITIDNPTAEIGLGDTHLATFSYLDAYEAGISGANVSIDFTGPTDGIIWAELIDIGGGDYSIEFSAVHSGSYAITISASKDYYEESQGALFIFVGEISTSLTLENGTAAIIRYGEQFRLVVQYTNSSGFGLDTASVSVESTTPETGLNYTTATYEGNGYFSIILTPTETATYTLLINASLTDHRTQFVSFTLTATTIQSHLIADVSIEVISVDQYSIVTLNFSSEIYGGLDNATISPLNPPADLFFSTVTPLGGGLYSIEVTSSLPGSYQIVFNAHAINHNNATTAFILTVINIPTQSRVASGAASASIEFSQLFEILVFYERIDETPANISLALLQVEFTSIETLNWTVEPYGEGYILRIAADELGRWELTITAQKALHQTGVIQFVLFVTENPTLLDVPVIPPSVYIDDISSYVFTYRIEGGAGVVDADVSFSGIDPDWVSFTPIGDGNYNITFKANQTGTFSFDVIFAKYGYQMINQPVILSVTLIDTDLYTASGSSSASVVFGTVYEIEMYYENTLECLNVSSASIQVEFTSIETLNWTAEPYGDGYILRIEADELGRWELTITAQKANHQTGFVQFVLFVTENPTFLDVPVILSSVYIGNISSYVFAYSIEGGAGVIDADVSFSGIDPDWVSFTPIGDGNYSITIEANQTGTFSFNVIFAKYGYQMVNQPVAFQVNRIPLTIEMAAPTWMVTSDLTFSLALLDVTGTPVSDAFVNYTITQGGVDLHIGVMTEDPDSKGTYIATISQTRVPWTGNQLYSIKISVSKENHQVLNQGYQVNVYEYMPPGYEVQVFVQTVVPQAAFVIVALVSLVIGRRMYRANRRKKAIAILAVKRRFEDIRGILGIIVIHKASGLAVYSKILKGGFDEALMSAFITAITHFRTEFEVEAPHWEFGVVPISDIISIVPTRNLLCAFIVGVKPTMTLEDRMVRYARAVGEMFDETMAAPPREVIDDAVYGLLDSLFDDVMDGALLRQYRVKKDAPYPRNQKCLQTYIETYPPEDGFGLDSLADGMSMCGIQEGNIYQQIIDAIENGILESIDPQMENNGPLEGDDESFESEPADL